MTQAGVGYGSVVRAFRRPRGGRTGRGRSSKGPPWSRANKPNRAYGPLSLSGDSRKLRLLGCASLFARLTCHLYGAGDTGPPPLPGCRPVSFPWARVAVRAPPTMGRAAADGEPRRSRNAPAVFGERFG